VAIQSIERAAAILRALAGGSRRLGVSELSDRLGLAKGTVHGLLRTLQRMLYGETAGRGTERAWATVPMFAALLLLLMTGLAWPPGLAGALARITAVVAP